MIKQLKPFFVTCCLPLLRLRRRAAMALLLMPLLAMPAQGMESARNLVASDEDSGQAGANAGPVVVLETSMGNIEIALDAEKAPQTVANFLGYVDEGYYDKTIFHRVIDGFMIQGGGFTADMIRKPTRAAVQNEANNGLLNVAGSIAMARTSAPHSATSQFFINVVDNQRLDHRGESPATWGYAVFGHVVNGMDVVNAIKSVETASRGGHGDVPVEPVLIKRAYRKGKAS